MIVNDDDDDCNADDEFNTMNLVMICNDKQPEDFSLTPSLYRHVQILFEYKTQYACEIYKVHNLFNPV